MNLAVALATVRRALPKVTIAAMALVSTVGCNDCSRPVFLEILPGTDSNETLTPAENETSVKAPLSGDVLILGGAILTTRDTGSDEFFDPTKRKFVSTGSLHGARAGTAVALIPGQQGQPSQVLIAGGLNGNVAKKKIAKIKVKLLKSALTFDLSTGHATATGGALSISRTMATATWLDLAKVTGANAGKVLIAGGVANTSEVLDSAELYDPVSGTFSNSANQMSSPRAAHSATLLPMAPF
jgi:hypothetical protein